MNDDINPGLPRQTYAVLKEIIAYKQAHDGNTPGMDEIALSLSLAKSNVWRQINKLKTHGLLQTTPGSSRSLAVAGSHWSWSEPQPLPVGRVGDVLRCIVDYKITYQGNAPSHREIAQQLGVRYSGSIREYLDMLTEGGYIRTPYATDHTIEVVGGCWELDEAAMWASWQDGSQPPLPF